MRLVFFQWKEELYVYQKKKKKNEDFNNYLEVEVIRVNIPLEN